MPLSSSFSPERTTPSLDILEEAELLELELTPRRHASFDALQHAHHQHARARQQKDAEPHGIDLEALRRAEDQIAESSSGTDELADDHADQSAADTQA